MIKRINIIYVLILLITGLSVKIFIYLDTYATTRYVNNELKKYSVSSVFPLKNITNFEWTKVCIYGAYSRIEKSTLNFDGYTNIVGSPLNLDGDGEWALLFLDERQKIAYPVEIYAFEDTRIRQSSNCFDANVQGNIREEQVAPLNPQSSILTVLFLSE